MKYKVKLIFHHPSQFVSDPNLDAISTLEITYEPLEGEYDALITPDVDDTLPDVIEQSVTLRAECIHEVKWVEFNRTTNDFLRKHETKSPVYGDTVIVSFNQGRWTMTQPVPVKEQHEI